MTITPAAANLIRDWLGRAGAGIADPVVYLIQTSNVPPLSRLLSVEPPERRFSRLLQWRWRRRGNISIRAYTRARISYGSSRRALVDFALPLTFFIRLMRAAP
jgi:hypothetical protein